MAAAADLPAVESPQKVWNRVQIALSGATPQAQLLFKQLKMWLATQKGNPNLRFTSVRNVASAGTTGGLVTASTGAIIGAGVTTVYGIYLNKSSGATSYFLLFDDGTDDAISGLTAAVRLTLPSLTASTTAAPSENIWTRPAGLAIANGLKAASVTTPQGLTIAANTASDNGFILSA